MKSTFKEYLSLFLVVTTHSYPAIWQPNEKNMGGGNLLSLEDMAALTAAEEKRLGVNSPEFIRRHNEIMKMADEIQSRYKKNAPTSTANTDRSE